MAGDLVLVTGATGYLGFRILSYALEKGFKARIVVRKEEDSEKVTSSLPSEIFKSTFSFVVVPDFLAPGAFDEVVKDVKYIIHVASPIPGRATVAADDYDKFFIQTAVRGTAAVLEAAQRTSSVERIVVTSSAIALAPFEAAFVQENDAVFDAESRVPDMSPPFPVDQVAYAASKIAAYNHALAWVQQHKPAFDVIHVHPSFVFGRDGLATTPAQCLQGTNRLMLSIALGKGNPDMALPNSYCHVDDVARVHVGSLDAAVKGNQSFLVTNTGQDGMTWDDVTAIIAKRYPDPLKEGVFKEGKAFRTVKVKWDVRKTEETFGFKHASLEDVVTSLADHYLELLGQEGKAT